MQNVKKVSLNSVAKEILIDVMKKLKPNELAIFLDDTSSSKEIRNLSRRVLVAGLRYQGLSFSDIGKLLGCSTNLVNKVHFKTKGSKILRNLITKSKSFNKYFPIPVQKTGSNVDSDLYQKHIKNTIHKVFYLD